MIVNETFKTVIITPPRCASTSLHVACRHTSWISTGPQPMGDCGTHTVHMPREHMKPHAPINRWRIILVTRNPYSRLVSLHQHLIDNTDFGYKTDFPRFVDTIMYSHIHTFYTYPVFKWKLDFEQANPDASEVIPIDVSLIESALKNIGWDIELGHFNKTHGRASISEIHTPETIEFTKKWAVDDFREFDYNESFV